MIEIFFLYYSINKASKSPSSKKIELVYIFINSLKSKNDCFTGYKSICYISQKPTKGKC